MVSRYRKILDINGIKWCKKCPVILLKGALLCDEVKKQNLLQIKFQSIEKRGIVGVEMEYTAYSLGDELLSRESYSYLDLEVNLNDEFGEKSAVYLQNNDARKFSFFIKKIFFKNGEVWENSDQLFDVESQCKLKEELDDLYNQFQFEYKKIKESNGIAEYFPVEREDYWQCSCGALNLKDFSSCRCCGVHKEKLLEILDRKYLLEEKEKLQIEEQERKEEEKKLKEEKHKKAKKVILMSSICCGITIVLLFAVYGLINFVIPTVKYSVAEKKFESENYEEAANDFGNLGNYKNSKQKLIESEYLLGCKKYGEKSYVEAEKAFRSISDYKDSSDYLEICQNYINYDKAKQDANKGNFKNAVELLKALPSSFEDSDELEKEYALSLGEICLSEKNYDEVISLYEEYQFINDTYYEACYQKGILCQNQNAFDDAMYFFIKCKNYRDASKKEKECISGRDYDIAIQCMEEGTLTKAIEMFKKAGNYKEAKKYKKLCEKSRHYAGMWKCMSCINIDNTGKKSKRNAAQENLLCKVCITKKGKVQIFLDDELTKWKGNKLKWTTWEDKYKNTLNLDTGSRTEQYSDSKTVYKYKIK